MKANTDTLVLTVLLQGERYGYEIIREVQKTSEGLFELREGTLYPILHMLEARGMVVSRWAGGVGTRQRKYYAITDAGREVINGRKQEWIRFRTAVDQLMVREA